VIIVVSVATRPFHTNVRWALPRKFIIWSAEDGNLSAKCWFEVRRRCASHSWTRSGRELQLTPLAFSLLTTEIIVVQRFLRL
jgi:hypothetical protein